ncbi:MAG: hypothetical protein LBT42_07715 [Tannerella sp.]|jgi:hypothetical protein|nr:hypothetical protein [Tannerella sp.]
MTKTRKCYTKKGQSAVIARNEAIQRPVYFLDCFVPRNDGKRSRFPSSFFLFAKLV